MQVELRRIHSELNVNTLLVTHSQEEALVLSDRIAVMRRGKIEAIGAPDAVYNRPPNEFVCNFVGDANIFVCDIEQASAGDVLLRSGALRFEAAAPAGVRSGSTLRVAVRPENVVLHRTQQPQAMTGTVKDAIFKGSHIDYVVAAGTIDLHVLSLAPNDGPAFGPGDAVFFSFPKSRVIPLAEDNAHV
jgi:ABC-type Fe3+/spermidine/putrescine transport system ATPase subunit